MPGMPQHPPHVPDDEAPRVPIGDAAPGMDDAPAPTGLPPDQPEETGEDPGSQQDG
jgi:hypothetical protein